MSFAIWDEEPKMQIDLPEMVIKVGDKWVVTDTPERATQAEVDAVMALAKVEALP